MSAPVSGVTTPVPEAAVRAHVAGSVSGQVAVGTHINQVGSVHGDLILHQHRPPAVEPRLRPLDRRPSPFPDLLGREAEVASAVARLRSGRGTDFHGPAGVGKSSVLRHVAHHPAAGTLPDGVLYCPGRGRPLPDLLQLVFDGFYDAEMGFTPTPGQLAHYVSSLAALVVIDDLELSDQDLGALVDSLPGCTFLLTSDRRRQWEPGRATALRGLPEPAALALLERELERPLAPEEQEPARVLWQAIDGHPRRLVQAASLVTDEGRSLAQVAEAVAAGQAEEQLAGHVVAGLSVWEREVLALVAAVGPAPLPVERAAAITGRSDSADVLEALRVKGLVKAHSPRYSLTVALPDQELAARDRWAERALDHYAGVLESERANLDRFDEDIDAIRALTAWAAGESRHREVIRLVRLADPVLAVARRWEARSQLVGQALTAARSTGDLATVAWCQHQLGTRAFWLGDEATAWYRLSRALELRRSLGDRDGAEVTQFHLDRLGGPPPGDEPAPTPEQPPPPPVTGPPVTGPQGAGPHRRSPVSPLRAVVTATLVVLAGAVLLLARDRGGEAPVAVVPIGATAVEVKPSVLSFGARQVGTESSRSVTLTVKGPGPLNGRGASVQGEDFAVADDRCRDRVDVGRSCRVTVTFAPSAAGDRLATLLIGTDDGQVEVALAGTGSVEGAKATATPVEPSTSSVPGSTSATSVLVGTLRADRAEVSFGKVRLGATTPPIPVVVRNTGQATVKITAVKVSGPARDDFKVSDTCRPAPLAVSSTCQVSVTFAPGDTGARVGTLTVTGEGGPALTVALAGSGFGPKLTIDPSKVDFGKVEVGQEARAAVTVTNTGTEPTNIIVTITSPNKGFGQESGCAGTLEPQGNCTIRVLFDPGIPGSFGGTVLVSSDAGPQLIATLEGTGTPSSSTTTPMAHN